MNIIISNSSTDPIYVQILNQIKGMIMEEKLSPGDALPSIRSLAKELGISVITTKRAYEELEKTGFIDTVKGKGSFVSAKNRDLIHEAHLKEIEGHLTDAVKKSRIIGLSLGELKELLSILYTED